MNPGAVRPVNSCCLCHGVTMSHRQVISLGFPGPSSVSPVGITVRRVPPGVCCWGTLLVGCSAVDLWCVKTFDCSHTVVCCRLFSEAGWK